MAVREGWKLCENFVGNDKTCMRVQVSPEAQNNITQVSVYDINTLITALLNIKMKLPASERRVQVSFSKEQIGIVMFLKGWSQKGESFFPDKENEYVLLAPVIRSDMGVYHDTGFKIWEMARTIDRTVVETIPIGNATEICPNHAGMASEEEILEKLEA